MANIQNSIFAYGLTRSGRIVIADHSMFDDQRGPTETGESDRDTLREATTYANFARQEEAYIRKAKETGTTAYAIAITDWFGVPKVLEIDVDNWTGQAGQMIRVKARDNVMVAGVTIVIRDLNDNVLEAGEAVLSKAGSAWWNYTTRSRVRMNPFPIVEVTAQDLAGNEDSFAIS